MIGGREEEEFSTQPPSKMDNQKTTPSLTSDVNFLLNGKHFFCNKLTSAVHYLISRESYFHIIILQASLDIRSRVIQFPIVQLGPGLKFKTKALDQSRTLNSLWTTHHPPTENFLQGSRHSKRLKLNT